MKAYVTSIGEPTTNLCVWSLERNGFDVDVIEGGGLLVDKLKTIYERADDDFVRVDADVVPNRNFMLKTLYMANAKFLDAWWIQFLCYDWLKQYHSYGGVQFIRKEALPALRSNVDSFHNADRPETQLSRIAEFYKPRRFESSGELVGLHGFALGEQLDRVRQQKQKRAYYDTYDFEMVTKLEGLLK